MTRFLLFTMHAPMAAMGEIAVGERRSSWPRPGRSAVFGLIAAALGIERSDEAQHQALNQQYGYAVRTDAPGRPLRDYHTAQAPSGKKARNFPTRREELKAGKLETVLSSREYYTDACFTVAIWAEDCESPAWSLQDLAEALRRPRFTPYFGRKACPLGAPFNPCVFEKPALDEAFAAFEPFDGLNEPLLELEQTRSIAIDARSRFAPVSRGRTETRRDTLYSRKAWQFIERQECIYDWCREPQ